jgi:hypothetical protein
MGSQRCSSIDPGCGVAITKVFPDEPGEITRAVPLKRGIGAVHESRQRFHSDETHAVTISSGAGE